MTAKLSVGVPEIRPDVHMPVVWSKTTSFEALALAVAGNAIEAATIITVAKVRLTLSSLSRSVAWRTQLIERRATKPPSFPRVGKTFPPCNGAA
jgi:hypothetical protein